MVLPDGYAKLTESSSNGRVTVTGVNVELMKA